MIDLAHSCEREEDANFVLFMSLVGKVMVFKGKLAHKREFAESLAESWFGVKVEPSITRATNVLVCGSGVGAKAIEDAKKKGIQVWTQDDFWSNGMDTNLHKPQASASADAPRDEKPLEKAASEQTGNAAGSGGSGGGKAAGSRKQKAAPTAAGDKRPAKKAAR